MKRVTKQKGFSLVELMVVVAIIGVLATIAIPRVNRFIAKARTSEAQINLSSIYTFNKNFFLEFQGYTNSFPAMGFRPEGNLRYNVGWTGGALANNQYNSLVGAPVAPVASLADCPDTGANPRCRTVRGANNAVPGAPPSSALAADFSTFTASATACLVMPAGVCIADNWQINQDKNMRNTQAGID